MSIVLTGGRRDLIYHGWLYLSCFGRAKFTDGSLVGFEHEPKQPSESKNFDEIGGIAKGDRETGLAKDHSVSESTMGLKKRSEVVAIGRVFRSAELPGLHVLDAFTEEISPDVRSKLAWQLNKSLGIDTNAISQLLKDKSIAEEWLRFEQESAVAIAATEWREDQPVTKRSEPQGFA